MPPPLLSTYTNQPSVVHEPEPKKANRKKRADWSDHEVIVLCQVWPKNYAKLKKASTKFKNKIWLEIYSEFLNEVDTKKDLEQIKTKTRTIEKEFKDIKLRMSRTGEEGAAKVKEKIKDTYDLLDQYLSERDSIDPEKMSIISSGLESDIHMTDDDDGADADLETSSSSTGTSNKKIEKRVAKRKRKNNDDLYELLRLSVENQTKNNEIMTEAAKELRSGMKEQATVLVDGFKDVMKSILENKK